MARIPSLPSLHLSKSRYVAGIQCAKMLWWRVHDAEAAELTGDSSTRDIFDRGNRIGELARTYVPGGVLIDLPAHQLRERVDATAEALAEGAQIIYEASFFDQRQGGRARPEGDVFVSVDILERRRGGFVLIEVKSTLDVKVAHIPDVAVQVHVVRRAGLPVRRAEVMHLNRECEHPDLSNLFVREDVTDLAEAAARTVPRHARSLLATLRGPLPDVETGPHCTDPYECPFMVRCWPKVPKHHVSTLYRISQKKIAVALAASYETVRDLPSDFVSPGPAARQIASVKHRKVIVEPELGDALDQIEGPIAFLDFETINPAVPAWPGCRPYQQVPVQLSCHVVDSGKTTHHQWLAEGPGDPRPAMAAVLLAACKDARTVLAYNASFEARGIAGLAEAQPHVAKDLGRITKRLVDLLALVREHVYHPGFGGSFSIKEVLPALVPGMGYDDLEIADGGTASAALEKLLLGGKGAMTAAQQRMVRKALLAYCERDTMGMVRLWRRLRELGSSTRRATASPGGRASGRTAPCRTTKPVVRRYVDEEE